MIMKLRSVIVFALWANVAFVMWFGYGMVGSPKHFMAFLFVSGCIVAATIPAVWESLLLAQRVLNRDVPDMPTQIRDFAYSDDTEAVFHVDEFTHFVVRWNSIMWDCFLMGSDGDVWDFRVLDSASFYNLDDALFWVETTHTIYELSDTRSI